MIAIPGKERTQPVFRGALLGIVGEHQQACFMISTLPCSQKAVGDGESGYVIRIRDGLDLCASENRPKGQGNENYERSDTTGTHRPIMQEQIMAPKNSRRASL